MSFIYLQTVTRGLKRYYGEGYLHFITTRCYRRLPLLGTASRRDMFLTVLEQVRQRYRYKFVVAGYVVMPEHIHSLISEPAKGNPSPVMQVLKQRFVHEILRKESAVVSGQVWQRRFYDFVVWNPKKRAEKIRYMHWNPVKRGLVETPEQWRWSSFRAYTFDETGPVLVDEEQPIGLIWKDRKAS